MTTARIRSRLKRRRLPPRWGDSLAPLLDVIFLLVIFLLVSARFDHTQTIAVDLPQAQGETKPTSVVEALVVTLREDGSLLWLDQEVSTQQLTDLLSQLPPEERLRPLTIRADGDVALETGIQLLEMLGLLGWSEVEFEVSGLNKVPSLLEDSPSDR